MKGVNQFFKAAALICVIASLVLYQKKASVWAYEKEVNEKEIAEVEAYNKMIEEKMASEQAAKDKEESESEKGAYKDGLYYGEGQGFGGLISVNVTILDGWIESIDVISHDKEDPAYYNMAEVLLSEITEQQITDVDTVSGATFSSKGLIAAVEEALEGAK